MASPQPEIRNDDANSDAKVATVDMKLEVVVIPVSDVERAEQFYRKIGLDPRKTPNLQANL